MRDWICIFEIAWITFCLIMMVMSIDTKYRSLHRVIVWDVMAIVFTQVAF